MRAKLPHFFTEPPTCIDYISFKHFSPNRLCRRLVEVGFEPEGFLPFHPISERKFFFCTKTLAPLECHSSSTAWEATASAVQWIDQ